MPANALIAFIGIEVTTTLRVRVALALAVDLVNFWGQSAVAAGWVQRARRLLRDRPESPLVAAIEGVEGHIALGAKRDTGRARHLSEDARLRARESGDVENEMLATAQLGLILVSSGDYEEGMRMLDEATATAVSGDISDAATAARLCCFMTTACTRVRDLDRAAQWTQHVMGMARTSDVAIMFNYPRAEHAIVLLWRGRWPEAERELLNIAHDRQGLPIPPLLAIATLADLRRRQGRFEEAAELLDELEGLPHRSGIGSAPIVIRAAVAFDRGNPTDAADLAERVLRQLPAWALVERVDGLAVLAHARSLLGDPEEASRAAEQLAEIAAVVPTDPIMGLSAFVQGVVAAGEGEQVARDLLERSKELFRSTGMPFEEGRARLELARCLLVLGRADSAMGEAEGRARGSGVRKHRDIHEI